MKSFSFVVNVLSVQISDYMCGKKVILINSVQVGVETYFLAFFLINDLVL